MEDAGGIDNTTKQKKPWGCPICQDGNRDEEIVSFECCDAFFHKDCIKGWFDKKKYDCPACREDLDYTMKK